MKIPPKYKEALLWVGLGVFTVILASALYYLVKNFEAMKLRGNFRRHSQTQNLSPEQIRGWMTFRYINSVFHLPAEYLKNSLNITDRRYPNLSLDSLAKEQKISSQVALDKIIGLITSFSPSQ